MSYVAARPREPPACDRLLVNFAIVFEPAHRVTIAWVAVCPVDHAALGVPFILAAERHHVAFAKADNSRRQIDVVRDEQRLTRGERHDEALMPASVVVVREHPANDALPFHLHVARALLEGAGERLVAPRERPGRPARLTRAGFLCGFSLKTIRTMMQRGAQEKTEAEDKRDKFTHILSHHYHPS